MTLKERLLTVRAWLFGTITAWCYGWIARHDPGGLTATRVQALDDPLSAWMLAETRQANRLIDVSGEYKAHVVIGKAVKLFPARRQRDLRLLLEQVIQLDA
jgi:hypothetical protein